MAEQILIRGDCIDAMGKMEDESIDLIITSPPYNLNIKYSKYKDDLPRVQYLKWMRDVAKEFNRILTEDGSIFLNVGYTNQDPWVAMDVANQFREFFILQNNITWVKHIKIDMSTYGIYKPISSNRYTTPTNESIFHFTKTGEVVVDRTAIVGEYEPRRGKYASSYTEAASLNRHEADIKRRTAKALGYSRWQDVEHQEDFTTLYQKKLAAKPFVWNAPKDEGNTWYIPYVPIAKLAKELGAASKGTKNTGRGGHPATYPESLPEKCIKFAGIPFDKLIVLDPFVGTGTTLVACKRLGVNAIGIDLDDGYLKFAQQRLDAI